MSLRWNLTRLAAVAMLATLSTLVPSRTAAAATVAMTASATTTMTVTSSSCNVDNNTCVQQAVAANTDSNGNVNWTAANPAIAACSSGGFFGGGLCWGSIGSALATLF